MGFTLHRGFESRPLRSLARLLGMICLADPLQSARMNEGDMLNAVRRLRAEGGSPRDIATVPGVKPSVVAPLVRQMGAQTAGKGVGELAGCWVSPGWSAELIVARREGWDDVDLGPNGPKGIVLALVARAERNDGVRVCGDLVDTFCLGVKNVIGPQRLRRRDLSSFIRNGRSLGANAAPDAGMARGPPRRQPSKSARSGVSSRSCRPSRSVGTSSPSRSRSQRALISVMWVTWPSGPKRTAWPSGVS